jgi:hypothetical protein
MTETETETGASRPSSQEERASWVKKKKKTKAGSNKVMNDERTEDWVRFMLLTCQIKHFMEG